MRPARLGSAHHPQLRLPAHPRRDVQALAERALEVVEVLLERRLVELGQEDQAFRYADLLTDLQERANAYLEIGKAYARLDKPDKVEKCCVTSVKAIVALRDEIEQIRIEAEQQGRR